MNDLDEGAFTMEGCIISVGSNDSALGAWRGFEVHAKSAHTTHTHRTLAAIKGFRETLSPLGAQFATEHERLGQEGSFQGSW